MPQIIGFAIVGLLAATVLILQVMLLRRKLAVDLSPVDRACERTERACRDEIARSRDEAANAARQARDELGNTIKTFGDSIHRALLALNQHAEQRHDKAREAIETRLQTIQRENATKLEQVRQDASGSAKALREEVGNTLNGFNESLVTSIGQMSTAHSGQLNTFTERLDKFTETNDQRLGAMRDTIEQRLTALQGENTTKLDQVRHETTAGVQKSRDEVTTSLKTFTSAVEKNVADMGSAQRRQLGDVLEQLAKLTDSNAKGVEALRLLVDERLRQIQDDSGKRLDKMREEAGTSAKQTSDGVAASLKAFNDSVSARMDALKTAVDERLRLIQEDNSKQLEQVRATVDEKLQGTLEKRLGESFKLVSERLEQVHKGLGEMQSLATGVGDLKKVLTNVKSRGTWGEVQLGALLEQVMTPEQYAANVATKEGGERVEFAIKLPGRGEAGDNEPVWLPIDAKFPTEDYQRLVEAQEKADPEAAEAAAKQLENRIKGCARDICEKYFNPPKTTDFAILFLPTEGLFAEVVRRTGVTEVIQRECRVMIAGPTTLLSILTSLQMGFKTLAIQKRSSEVWKLLAAVKAEFTKYGAVLAKVQKKLVDASDTIDKEVAVRARAIERKLRGVEELPAPEAHRVLQLSASNGDGNGESQDADGAS